MPYKNFTICWEVHNFGGSILLIGPAGILKPHARPFHGWAVGQYRNNQQNIELP